MDHVNVSSIFQIGGFGELMSGIVYCVGVGPGDPELMTLKAVRIISRADIIVVPGKSVEKSVAWKIASQAVPELNIKKAVAVDMPMTSDREVLFKAHRKGADIIEKYLDEDKDVAYLTLGDPTIYCSFHYLQLVLNKEGYKTVIINGITSFCASAAKLGISLTQGEENLSIIGAGHNDYKNYNNHNKKSWDNTNLVIMKSGKNMRSVKEALNAACDDNKEYYAVTNCGMEDERCYNSLQDIPDDAGYYTLIIGRCKSHCEEDERIKNG